MNWPLKFGMIAFVIAMIVAFCDLDCLGQTPEFLKAPFSSKQIKESRRIWEKKGWKSELQTDIGIEFMLVPPGNFTMGLRGSKKDKDFLHRVSISKPYYVAKTEITQRQWKLVMNSNPSDFTDRSKEKAVLQHIKTLNPNNLPVETVEFDQVLEFVAILNKKYPVKGFEFKLPTEAQWEFACRAGTDTAFSFGEELKFGKHAWFWDDEPVDGPSEVGRFLPNQFGLHDMHGNVLEWCSDNYFEQYYETSPRIDPAGPKVGKQEFNKPSKVIKGGSWMTGATNCQSGFKSGTSWAFWEVGFRVILARKDAKN